LYKPYNSLYQAYDLTLKLRALAMANPHKIALIGFTSFERATFESFFRLAARRPPGYTLVNESSEADLAVVNADDAPTLSAALANKPAPKVMLIGSSDGGTNWPIQRRPLNLMKVLTTVEQLLAPVAPAVAVTPVQSQPQPQMAPPTLHAATAAPMTRPAAATGFDATRPFSESGLAGLSAVPAAPARSAGAPLSSRRNEVRLGAADFSNSRADGPVLGANSRARVSPEEAGEGNLDHILVVDDSDIALKFMRNRLTRFGFRTDLVNSGEEALGRLSARPYKFVFLDVMMEGLDGYQTCRAIKQRKYVEGKPPVVVMLTSRGGTIDKIRGTLAGCDAYLTKPLNERDLIAVLAKHDRTVARGFQATNFGSSSTASHFGSPNTR
jgi:two-component system, cell cycle response regulator